MPPAAAAVPTEEKARYDRSERLWGAEAQKLLRTAHVVLLGATATGSEALKNLVLPGLGKFTIVDAKPVTRRDLGNNFFLEQEDEGKNRAAAVVPILRELNPMVEGQAVERSVADVVEACDTLLLQELKPSVVLATADVTPAELKKLGDVLAGKQIPLVYAATNGMVGFLRLQSDPTFVLHTVPGPDTKVHDLRPLNPFPGLKAFFDKYDPEDRTLDHHDFAHIPWFCVVYHAVRKWQANHARTAPPATGAEWRQVKSVIETYARVDPVTNVLKIPDSFKDAMEQCSLRIDLTRRNTPELNRVLRDPRAALPTKDDDLLWFFAFGLRQFREAHAGVMPVNATIPDFECTTAMYRDLQQIFRQQAALDAGELAGYARDAMLAAGVDASGTPVRGDTVDEAAQKFAQQAWEVNYAEYPTVREEYESPLVPSKLTADGTSALRWYAAYRGAAALNEDGSAAPLGRVASASAFGTPDEAQAFLQDEAARLAKSVRSLWPEAPADIEAKELYEYVRYAGGEPVTVAAIVGAVASQETIKLIQNRRRPISHTLVYDGVENCFTTIGLKAA